MLPNKQELDDIHARQAGNTYQPDPTIHNTHSDNTPVNRQISVDSVQGEDKSLYQNLNAKGEPSERTDPALDKDGYLKSQRDEKATSDEVYSESNSGKVMLVPGNASAHAHAGNHQQANLEDNRDSDNYYGNENLAQTAAVNAQRNKSVDNLNVQRIKANNESTKSDGYDVGRVNETGKGKYVNLEGNQKGGEVFGVEPKKKSGEKKQPKQKSETKYANIGNNDPESSVHYANLMYNKGTAVAEEIYENNP